MAQFASTQLIYFSQFTRQGSGTFVSYRRPDVDRTEQQRMLDQILTDMLARASAYGLTLDDLLKGLRLRKEGLRLRKEEKS